MLLAIDIGNTHTVLGVFRSDQLVAEWRIASSSSLTAEEIWRDLKNRCTDLGVPVSELNGVGISSVVPGLTGVFETVARKHLNLEPLTINASLDLGLKIQYKDPMTLGADRLCNAVAGFRKFGGPLIIIDFGTATTYSVVSVDGDLLGGVIALGIKSAAEALSSRGAKLPKIDLQFPESAVGRDTVSCMQAGIMMGAVDSVDAMIKRIRSEIGGNARVVATGGLAPIITKHINAIEAREPALVLDGIRLVYERVFRLKKPPIP